MSLIFIFNELNFYFKFFDLTNHILFITQKVNTTKSIYVLNKDPLLYSTNLTYQ